MPQFHPCMWTRDVQVKPKKVARPSRPVYEKKTPAMLLVLAKSVVMLIRIEMELELGVHFYR